MVEEKKEKIANMLRLARKAKAVELGRKAAEKWIFRHKNGLIFSGKKDNSFIRKKAEICKLKGFQISFIFSDEDLGKIFGRRKLTLVAINNIHFIEGIKKILND